MAVGDTVHICEFCREILDHGEPVVAATRLHHVDTLGGRVDAEGLRVFFHARHWPGEGLGFRFRARTTVADALRDSPCRRP